MSDKIYPEQVDPNLICDQSSPRGMAFPPRSGFTVGHLLARANARDASDFAAIVVGVDKSNGDKFVSTTVDMPDTAMLLRILYMEVMAGLVAGEEPVGMDDADPDSSPRSGQ